MIPPHKREPEMTDTLKDTRILLDAIEVGIRRGEYREKKIPRRIIGWEGPGAVFSTRLQVSADAAPCNQITVVTPHAHTAGWLLDRIESAFSPLLGEDIKYDFFERIAEAVNEYSAVISLADDSDINILKLILREARDILGDMETGEFPHVPQDD
jgi:hypothetical protein